MAADVQEGLDLRRRARRRLIGAVALVLALVVVPPWIMDLEPKPVATRLSVEIPSQDAAQLKPPARPAAADAATKPADSVKPPASAKSAAVAPTDNASRSLDSRTVAALGAPKTAEPAAAEAAKASGDAPAAPPKPAAPASKPAEAAKKPAEAPSVQAARAPAGEGFVVPLGAFGNPENAKQLQARLAKEGIQTYAEPVRTAAGEQTRVRAGPYPSREAAEKVRGRVKEMGIEAGNVVARP